MKSKTSFIDKGILRNDFKSWGWIAAVYLLVLLLSLPLKLFMVYSRYSNANPETIINNPNIYKSIFWFSSPLQAILVIVVPVLTALLLFRYLQSSKASDMAHALPVKRGALYNTHILAGLLFLLVPLLITAFISWLTVNGLEIKSVNGTDILIWLGTAGLFNIFLFIAAVFTGTFTGMSTVQGVLTYILLFLPAGLFYLILHNTQMYIYGFAYDYYLRYSEGLTPLVRLIEYNYAPLHPNEIIIYLLLSAVLYLAGRYLYQKRQLERAGNAIAFDGLVPFFKYGVTFCFTLVGGSYFFSTQQSMAWTYFGYALFSLLAYFSCEILLNKSIRVFNVRNFKAYGIYAVVMIVGISALHLDLAGFEERQPQPAEIESIFMDSYYGSLKPKSNTTVQHPAGQEIIRENPTPIYTDANNITNIYNLHKELINHRQRVKAHAGPGGSIRKDFNQMPIGLAYKLKDGSWFCRQYYITQADYVSQLKPIYESSEYKYLHYPILGVKPTEAKMLEISVGETGKHLEIIEKDLVGEAVTALQKDILEQKYTADSKPAWAEMRLVLNHREVAYASWAKSYSYFAQWLKETGYYEKARLMPSDIRYAVIVENSEQVADIIAQTEKTTRGDLQNLEEVPGSLKVNDEPGLETCLQNYSHSDQQPYRIVFIAKGGTSFTGGFSEADAPEFVKEHFAKQKSAGSNQL